MILEVAILDVIAGREVEFEGAFADASRYIQSVDGYLGHELRKCLEQGNRYIFCSCIGGSLKTTLRDFVTPSNISRGVKPCIIFTIRSPR